jgi:hypothetical protein
MELGLPPALGYAIGWQVSLDTENHFARELLGDRFKKRLLVGAWYRLPENDPCWSGQ